MYAGVGTACAVQSDALPGQALKNADDLTLYRGLVRLRLPAVVVRSVVSDGQFEVAHSEGIGSFGRRNSGSRADKPASRLDGCTSLLAQRAVVGVIAGDIEFEERL